MSCCELAYSRLALFACENIFCVACCYFFPFYSSRLFKNVRRSAPLNGKTLIKDIQCTPQCSNSNVNHFWIVRIGGGCIIRKRHL